MNKMFKFNGMPYKGSGRAGGKSVSMIGMLVLLLAALLVLPSCFDDDDDTATGPTCGEGTVLNADTNMCDPVSVDLVTCGEGTMNSDGVCVPTDDSMYEPVGETDADNPYEDGDGGHMLIGGDDADYIDGQGGNDSIKGMGGNDDLTGGAGDDTLYGGEDDDKLDGGTGDDTLDGGPGDDELTPGSGDNTLDGGEGDDDIVIYLGALGANVELSMDRARVQHAEPESGNPLSFDDDVDSGVGIDSLMNIENVKGTHGNDIINGDGKANRLEGLDGADVINGHGDDDTILPNRPAGVDDMGVAVTNTAADDDLGDDGEDVVDGGDGSDTISYEGESASATVEVDLSTVVPAVEDTSGDDAPDNSVIAHVAATIGSVTDMITVGNIGTEDEPNVVSTIEHVTGGFGRDMLTGDARANTLTGGAGDDTLMGGAGDDTLSGGAGGDTLSGGADDDTLMGGAGDDTLMGGAGDDTLSGGADDNTLTGGADDDYYAVVVGDTGGVTEAADGGMDTLHYIAKADVDGTEDDESEEGVGEAGTLVTTSVNVEVTLGTPNADFIRAHDNGATVLGREGNDTLTGGAGVDTLVGCVGENTLTGGGEDDVFGVFNGGTDDAADTITDFTTGTTATATTDEIHLKGFEAGATVTITPILANATHAAVNVNGVPVVSVASVAIVAIGDDDNTMDVDESRTVVEAIIDALGKDDAVQMVDFDIAKCSSN